MARLISVARAKVGGFSLCSAGFTKKRPESLASCWLILARNYSGSVQDIFECTYENTGFVNVIIIFIHFSQEFQWFRCGHVFRNDGGTLKKSGFGEFMLLSHVKNRLRSRTRTQIVRLKRGL